MLDTLLQLPACSVASSPSLQAIAYGEAPMSPGLVRRAITVVMSGYLDRPDLTECAMIDGWFRGDYLTWADDEGYLHLAGRKAT